jgi:H+-transporting ATPase
MGAVPVGITHEEAVFAKTGPHVKPEELERSAGQSTDLEKGFTPEEVRRRLDHYGFNEIIERKHSRAFSFIRKFWGITPWMLELTIGLEWFLGKHFEAYVVAGLLVFNAILGFMQEEKANGALELLKQKLKVNARVKRNGAWTMVQAGELVPGDVVRLRAGDFVPADVNVAEGTASVDQSSLTGESQAIEKKKDEVLYGGSVVRRGEVTGIVIATGTKTYFGKTVELVQVAKPKLHMEQVTSRVVRWLVVIVSSFLLIAFIFTVLRGMNLLEILPLAVVLMVSAIPVALPTMFTISMALGSVRLIRKGVLITRLSAIEDAATMTILCADKTGTITTNRLSVTEVVPAGTFSEKDVILYGALASEAADQDPIDMAFISAAAQTTISLQPYARKSFVPFDASTRRTEATLERDGRQFTALKGAVNTIASLCKEGTQEVSRLAGKIENMSSKGYRTLAVAEGESGRETRLVGIAFLYDKPRPDSAQLIGKLKGLGLDIKMLTGDALPIAREIARQLGLGDRVTRIADLKQSSGEQILRRVQESDGFAEIYPEDKYLIVENLQKVNQIVGMTGDGVNDAPALRQAEVGIAVSSATDVAKKAAGAVLTTEGLEGIVDLVTIGRATYQRIITWILNKIIKTFQITVFVVLAFLLTGHYVISALHMILLLFLTDFVTLSLSTDNVRVSARPDNWDITGLVKVALFLGILVIAELMLFIYLGSSYFSFFADVPRQQTFTFEMLIYVELLDVLIIRERRRLWNSRPSTFLLLAIAADLLLVFFLSTAGIPGIAPVGLAPAISVPILAFLLVFLVNDPIKALLVRRFWARV